MKAARLSVLAVVAVLIAGQGKVSGQTPMGTAFTYQGRLTDGGEPANGLYDFEFALFEDAGGTSPVGSSWPVDDLPVTDGLFTADVDFGVGGIHDFTGDARWLRIGVRPGDSTGAYTPLAPLQELTPAPYALALPGLWTQQNTTSPNVIGGFTGNSVTGDVAGATIGGGGQAGQINQVSAGYYGTVGGGVGNTASGSAATVSGGQDNSASGSWGTVGGGLRNTAAGSCTVAGGQDNAAQSIQSTVGGGSGNTASGSASTVPGGNNNTAGAFNSFAAGTRAKVRTPAQAGNGLGDYGTFVWADFTTSADFTSTGPNQFLIRASGGVGIGTNAPQAALHIGNTGQPSWDGIMFPDGTLQTTAGGGGGIGGSGTVNFLPKFTATTTIGNSVVYETGGNVGIGTTSPGAKLDIAGTGKMSGFQLTASPTAGYVLTADASGVGTWQAPTGGGLTLPYSDSVSSSGPAFEVSNTGAGYAIRGTAPNNAAVVGETPSNDYPGVWGKNTGAGPAVAGTASGSNNIGVQGAGAGTGDGVYGISGANGGAGVHGKTDSPAGWGGYFEGRGYFSGNLGIGTTAPGAELHVAGVGRFATLTSFNNAAATTVEVMGQAYGSGSQVNLKDASSTTRVQFTAANSEVKLFDSAGATRIRLDGASGRTVTQVLEITGGSDLSEQFNVAVPTGQAKPGMVVCIDPENAGELVVSTKSYDRTVAGLISGAGGVKPGMLMSQKTSAADGEHPVALTGRAYCWADASRGAIVPGDLLTTSDVPGHAMKVADHARAQGATLGKAMTGLAGGRGLVLVLVALQ